MVLVDTSVWIRFLANRAPYAAALDRLLVETEATAHDLVEGELLIGDPGGRKDLMNSYSMLHRTQSVRHAEVTAFVRLHKLHGRGLGWIDANLLASALIANVQLWTADERLASVAGDFGVAYIP